MPDTMEEEFEKLKYEIIRDVITGNEIDKLGGFGCFERLKDFIRKEKELSFKDGRVSMGEEIKRKLPEEETEELVKGLGENTRLMSLGYNRYRRFAIEEIDAIINQLEKE